MLDFQTLILISKIKRRKDSYFTDWQFGMGFKKTLDAFIHYTCDFPHVFFRIPARHYVVFPQNGNRNILLWPV